MARDTIREPIRHIVIAPRVVACGAALILLLASAAGVYWHWRFGLPPRTDDLRAIHAASATITNDLPFDSPDNALHRYRALFIDVLGAPGADIPFHGSSNERETLRLWRQAQRNNVFSNLRAGEWGDPRHAPMLSLLPAFRPVLDALDHAAELERFRPRYSSSGDVFNPVKDKGPVSATEVQQSHISAFRFLGLVNAAQMRVSAHSGDWADVEQRVRSGRRLASHLGDEPFLFSLVIGASVDATTLEELRLILGETEPPRSTIDALIDLVATPEPQPMRAARLELEKRRLVGEVRWAFGSDAGDVWTSYFWETRFESESPRRIIRDGNRYIDEMARYMALSRDERDRAAPPDAGAAADYVWPLDRAFASLDQAITQRAGTLALLRILRFEREHGRLPRTLDEAMTTEQATDPVTGKPFVYLIGRDGMREVDPTLDETSGVRTHPLAPAVASPVGPRWRFTLHAPLEAAAYMSNVELTRRRGEIYIHPNATP